MTTTRGPYYRLACRRMDFGEIHILPTLWDDLNSLRFYTKHYSRICPGAEFFPVDLEGNPIPEPMPETDAP